MLLIVLALGGYGGVEGADSQGSDNKKVISSGKSLISACSGDDELLSAKRNVQMSIPLCDVS
jgi:hypothetical protein